MQWIQRKILRVDLNRNPSNRRTHESIYSRYLGGGTLALYYLLKELKPKSDRSGRNNIMVFAGSSSRVLRQRV